MKDTIYFYDNFGSRRKRRTVVKAVIALLTDIRNAETISLNNMPDNLQHSVKYETGEFAVDALDEAIAILADAY